MTILPILSIPDPRLREISKPVEKITDSLRKLADDMLETMYDAPGVGLAAIQVGHPVRLLVADPTQDESAPRNPMIFFNPERIDASEETGICEEGCLSVPAYYAEVRRPLSCTVRYLDVDGKQQELFCEGFTATVIQHEMDHLDGKMFIDYLSKLKRDRVIKKLTRLHREKMDLLARQA